MDLNFYRLLVENEKNVAIFSIFFVTVIFFIWNSSPQKNLARGVDFGEYKVTFYTIGGENGSVGCSCCVNTTNYLKEQGFQVEIITVQNMTLVKEKYQIPRNMRSCHTMLIGDYFVEGHMPVEAIKKLLEEKPAIDGISLPGMPLGSPGMPSTKKEEFKIYALSNGTPSEFMTI